MRYRPVVGGMSRNCQEPTTALRTRSPNRLRGDLNRYLLASEPKVDVDPRDVMVGLAPFFDCAKRLGVDPVDLFERASRDIKREPAK